MDEFAGKVVLITGAGRGLGREAALVFSSLGALIAANDINPLGLDEIVHRISQAGGTARPYVFDIAKRMPIEGMVSQVLDHFGRIDFLVNHAAVMPHARLLDMDEWEFHRTLDVNLGGPFFTMQQVGRVMRQQGAGVIINNISTSGFGMDKIGYSAFSASQAGLIGLTRAAAAELASDNIRVNLVGSGPVLPGLDVPPGWDPAACQDWLSQVGEASQKPLSGALGLVVYLCSQAASSITGQVIWCGQDN
jgi:NAD(P)-dependent dehydrogenase (short-subunit alcohol dehydrogenase family)